MKVYMIMLFMQGFGDDIRFSRAPLFKTEKEAEKYIFDNRFKYGNLYIKEVTL